MMKTESSGLSLSPTDLAKHLGCRDLTQLDLAVARGSAERPGRYDPFIEVLRKRGDEHEQACVERLHSTGRSILDLRSDQSLEATKRALATGADVIIQPYLAEGSWRGRADVLRRVDVASSLGSWSYEPVDTKLSSETKAGTLLQLLHEEAPESHVELLGGLFQVERFGVPTADPLEKALLGLAGRGGL